MTDASPFAVTPCATPYSLVRFERGAIGLVVDVKKNGSLRVALVSGAQPNAGEVALFAADGTITSFGEHRYKNAFHSTSSSSSSPFSSSSSSSSSSSITDDTGKNSSFDDSSTRTSSTSATTSASLPVDTKRRGREFCGRVVDCLGRPIDGKGPLSSSSSSSLSTTIEEEDIMHIETIDDKSGSKLSGSSSPSPSSPSSSSYTTTNVPLFFRDSPSIINRDRIKKTLTTGFKAIDGFNPLLIGTGNLLTGERGSGKQKTALEIIATLSRNIDRAAAFSSTPLHQHRDDDNMYENVSEDVNDELSNPTAIIYVLTGCSVSAAKAAVKSLRDSGSLHNTAVVVSTANEPCGAQYMSIFTGLAIGESIRDTGGRAVVIVDNLTRLFVSARRVAGESTLATSSSSLASPVVSQTVGALFDRAAQLSTSHGGGSLTVLALIDTPPSLVNTSNATRGVDDPTLSSSRGSLSPGSLSSSSSSNNNRLSGKSLENTLFDYTRSLADTTIEFSSISQHRSVGSLIPIDFNALSETSRSHAAQGKGLQLASRSAREVLCELREVSKNVAIAQSVGVAIESEFDAAMSMLAKAKLLLLPTRSLLNEVLSDNHVKENNDHTGGKTMDEVGVSNGREGGGGGEGVTSSSLSSSSTTSKRMFSTYSSAMMMKRRYSTSSAMFNKVNDSSSSSSSPSSSSNSDKTIDKLVNKLDAAQLRTLLAVSGSRHRKSAAAAAAQANIVHSRSPPPSSFSSTSSSSSSSSSSTPLIDIAVNAAKKANIPFDDTLDAAGRRRRRGGGEEEEETMSISQSNSLSFSALYGKRSPSSNISTTNGGGSSSVIQSLRSPPPPPSVPISVAARGVSEDEDVIEGEAFHETLQRLEEKEEKKGLSGSTSTSSSSTSTSGVILGGSTTLKRNFSTTISRVPSSSSSSSFSSSSSSSSTPIIPSFKKIQLPPQTFADAVIKPLSSASSTRNPTLLHDDISSSSSSTFSSLSTWEDSPIRGDKRRTFLVLFCIANGYLSRVPLKRVFEFEAGLYTLLSRLPPPLPPSTTSSISTGSKTSTSPRFSSLLDQVMERGAGNSVFLLNTSRSIHQSLKALALRRIVLNARLADEAARKREEEAILIEKKKKEERSKRGSPGGSTFASFFFGGKSSTASSPPPPPPPSSSSSSSSTVSTTSTPLATDLPLVSGTASSSFTFDDLIEGGSIAPEGMQAILHLIEAADLDKKKRGGINGTSAGSDDSVSKKEESSGDYNDNKITAAAAAVDDDKSACNHYEQNMKGIVEESKDESINDIACLAALHVSVATFIKIVFEEENLTRF